MTTLYAVHVDGGLVERADLEAWPRDAFRLAAARALADPVAAIAAATALKSADPDMLVTVVLWCEP